MPMPSPRPPSTPPTRSTPPCPDNSSPHMVARLAKEVMTLDTEIGDTETMIEDRFRRHRHAEIILSMPGFGVTLAAEFLAATGGDMDAFDSVDRLAGVSGFAPVPRDSGRITATSNDPAATTVACCAPATCPRRSPSAPTPPPASTTTAREPKARPTPRPSSPWPVDASTSCGPCSATTPPTNPQLRPRRLDNVIENPPVSERYRRCV